MIDVDVIDNFNKIYINTITLFYASKIKSEIILKVVSKLTLTNKKTKFKFNSYLFKKIKKNYTNI